MFTLSLELASQQIHHLIHQQLIRGYAYLRTRATLVVKLLPNINHCYSLAYFVNPCTSLTLSRVITKYWPTRVISTFNRCIIGEDHGRQKALTDETLRSTCRFPDFRFAYSTTSCVTDGGGGRTPSIRSFYVSRVDGYTVARRLIIIITHARLETFKEYRCMDTTANGNFPRDSDR